MCFLVFDVRAQDSRDVMMSSSCSLGMAGHMTFTARVTCSVSSVVQWENMQITVSYFQGPCVSQASAIKMNGNTNEKLSPGIKDLRGWKSSLKTACYCFFLSFMVLLFLHI